MPPPRGGPGERKRGHAPLARPPPPPIAYGDMKQWLETREVLDRLVQLARAGGGRAALATVVRVRGPADRHEGAKLLVAEGGRTTGTRSGGCRERGWRGAQLP